MNDLSNVQTQVRAVMAKQGVSMADLAARSGRRHSDVRRSLHEPHWWRLDRLIEYADALGVGVDALLPPAWRHPGMITGGDDLKLVASPEQRLAAALAAGATVAALGRIGERNRSPAVPGAKASR